MGNFASVPFVILRARAEGIGPIERVGGTSD